MKRITIDDLRRAQGVALAIEILTRGPACKMCDVTDGHMPDCPVRELYDVVASYGCEHVAPLDDPGHPMYHGPEIGPTDNCDSVEPDARFQCCILPKGHAGLHAGAYGARWAKGVGRFAPAVDII